METSQWKKETILQSQSHVYTARILAINLTTKPKINNSWKRFDSNKSRPFNPFEEKDPINKLIGKTGKLTSKSFYRFSKLVSLITIIYHHPYTINTFFAIWSFGRARRMCSKCAKKTFYGNGRNTQSLLKMGYVPRSGYLMPFAELSATKTCLGQQDLSGRLNEKQEENANASKFYCSIGLGFLID